MNALVPRIALFSIAVSIASPVVAQQVTVRPDVVYGHKLGLAMTMDVFTPVNPNGVGVLFMVSGGWYSRWSPPEGMKAIHSPLTSAGYTVFAVRHGSSPRFSIEEAVSDVRRSVRYVRQHADEFGVDPERLGVYGMSAGGHLSLMLGTTGDDGKRDSNDAILRESSRVAAVVAFVAPTDLRIMARGAEERLPAYDRFPALELDVKAAAPLSPLAHVTPDDAPTLLIAGDEDKLVPVLHSRRMYKSFQEKKVPSQLLEIAGAGHGIQGDDLLRATDAMVAWFDKHLKKTSKSP